MVMRMKGHNAILPCHMCEIQGVHNPFSSVTTNYVPLFCDNFPHSDGSYNPSVLPLRDPKTFMKQAERVQSAPTAAESEWLATDRDIKGVPLLSGLCSLSFPTSFPYNFMHLIWTNLISNLILLWTSKFKDLDHDGEDCAGTNGVGCHQQGHFRCWKNNPCSIWFSGSKHCIRKGPDDCGNIFNLDTIPRVAPVLLKGHFLNPCYYKHFKELVWLLTLCLEFEITQDEVDDLETGFQKWVKDNRLYVLDISSQQNGVLQTSRLYYQHDPERVSCCPLTIHALLHIAPTIRAMGPVWAYWAFPMEQHCSDILHHIQSWQFPYASINKYVLVCS